jgi:WD40 repeat protein
MFDRELSGNRTPDGTRIVSGSRDRSVRIWDALTGKEIQKLDGHTGPVSSVAFSPDGTRVVSGSDDESVRIWGASTGKEIQKLDGHTNWVMSVAFSPDGTRVISGSEDQSKRIWDASPGVELQEFDWAIAENGWVVNRLSRDRLLWLPQHIILGLRDRHCSIVISRAGTTGLDFSQASLGLEWTNCYSAS